MAKIDLYDLQGKKSGTVDLPKEIFEAKINRDLLAQAVRVYLANQRRAKAQTKTRSEVRGSGRKIWRQKGTGRARHGDRYAPIFVGGGRAHGPTGQENFQLKLTKKMKRQALFSALTSKLKKGEISAVKGLSEIKPKTKEAGAVLDKIARANQWDLSKGKTTLVLPAIIENVMRGMRNLARVDLKQAGTLNPYEVLNGGRLLLMEESVEVMKSIFLKTKKGVKNATK